MESCHGFIWIPLSAETVPHIRLIFRGKSHKGFLRRSEHSGVKRLHLLLIQHHRGPLGRGRGLEKIVLSHLSRMPRDFEDPKKKPSWHYGVPQKQMLKKLSIRREIVDPGLTR